MDASLVKKIGSGTGPRKILIWLLSLLVAFTVTGFFILPPIIKSVLIKKLSEQLHREVSIRQININPFVLSGDIKGFVIRERNSQDVFMSFEELYVNLQSVSIFKRGPVLSEIRLEKPYLRIVRSEENIYNFSDLLPKDQKDEKKPKTDTGTFRFSLNNIKVAGGRIDFEDRPKQTKHVVKDMDISIPFVSNLPYYVNVYVQPSFSAKVNETPVTFRGKTKPFADSLETSFEVNIKDFDIPYYLAYLPVKMNFSLLSGFIDADSTISYTQFKNKKPSLNITGDVAFKKVGTADKKGGRLFSLPKVEIGIAKSELMDRQVHLSKVLVESPEIDAVMDKQGRLNLLALMPESAAQPKPEPAAAKKEDVPAFAFEADEIRLTGGKVSFADHSRRSIFRTGLSEIEIKIDRLSNVRDAKCSTEASLKTEANETVAYKGEASVDPVASSGTVELKGIRLKKYAPYYEDMLLFDPGNAMLDLSSGYKFEKTGTSFSAGLNGLSAALRSLNMRKPGENEDFIGIPVVSVSDTSVDLTKREVTVGGLSTQKGILKIKRMKDGTLNVSNLIANAADVPAEKKSAVGAKQIEVAAEKSWSVKLKKITVDDYRVEAEDLAPARPVSISLDRIRFRAENISTAKNSPGKASVSLNLGEGGSIAADGSVGLDPPFAALKINSKGIDIIPFESYFDDKLNVILTGGRMSATGDLSVGYDRDSGPKVVYKGEASLSQFGTVDSVNADDFLKWDSLYFNGMDVGYNPLYVNINEIALTDFYSLLIINPDGSFNLQDIGRKEAAPAAAAPAAKQEPAAVAQELNRTASAPAAPENRTKSVKIGKLTLQGGTINFTDNYIKPNYSATLLEIGGRVSGLSSDENTLADVDLRGKLENYAPLEITGKVNPLKEELFVDLGVNFRDMDLSAVTPYSGKYAGYTIQKGKLSLSLKYLIVKKNLDAQNNVFLDQFTFGEKVDSPEATRLPVRLAVALLKNRKGEISLDIPVSGRLDDPKFSIGRIVLKIIVNLLVKAATSPFALLGALFGGGEELSYLDFDFGSFEVPAPGMKRLDTLVKALSERPSLKLEIEGYVDPEKDKEGLRQYFFNKKLKAQKLKETAGKGGPVVSVDDIKIEKTEYPKYLKMAYKEEKFPKPRNIIGMAKTLPEAEMEKLILTNIEVKDNDLRRLASQRALEVKDYILKSKQVEPERVFLVEPKSLQPEKKEKLKDSRVDFRLK